MRHSISSLTGMGRRAAIFQSSRLRYCITARWAMLGNSAECLPVITCCFLRRPPGSFGQESHEPANIAEGPAPSGATRRDCVAQYWLPVPWRGRCECRMEVFVSPRCFSTG